MIAVAQCPPPLTESVEVRGATGYAVMVLHKFNQFQAFTQIPHCVKISFFYDFKKNIYTVPSLVLVVVLFCQKNKKMKIKKIEVKNFVLTYDGMFVLEFNFIFIY